MSKDDRSTGDVWDDAQKDLDESASYQAESDALRLRLTAYTTERRALESQGSVPRGVRRRGERLLEEISALKGRPERPAEATAPADGDPKAKDSKKQARSSRSGNARDDAPSGQSQPSRRRGRSERGRER